MADGPAPVSKPAASRRKQIVGGIVTLAVLAIIFLVIIPQFVSYADAWAEIKSMTAEWVVALAIACVVNILVYVWPFLVAVPGLQYWPGFMVRQTSYALSNGIPTVGGAIGLGVQYSMLESDGIGSAPSAAGIAINSVWNLIATLVLPVVAVVALLLTDQASSQYVFAAVIGVAVIAVGGVVLALILKSDTTARKVGDVLGRIAERLLRLIHKDRDLHLGDALVSFRSSTVDVIRARWAMLTVSNLAMQLTSCAILFIALRAVEVGVPAPTTFAQTLTAFAIGRLGGFIPVTPGGLGTVDAAIVAILTAFGATSADALAADLIWRACTYVPQIVIGIITFLIWRRQQAHRARGGGGAEGSDRTPSSVVPATNGGS